MDRRESNRFPVREDVRYRVLEARAVQCTGAGRTVDISSGGILFTTSQPLSPGRIVELSINWPARLDGTCALQLVATGRIVRTESSLAAVRIERYEFKTRAARAPMAVHAVTAIGA